MSFANENNIKSSRSSKNYHLNLCTRLNYVYTSRQCEDFLNYLEELREFIHGVHYKPIETKVTEMKNAQSIRYHTNNGQTLVYQFENTSHYGISLSSIPSQIEKTTTETYLAEQHVLPRVETSQVTPPLSYNSPPVSPIFSHQLPMEIEGRMQNCLNSSLQVINSSDTEQFDTFDTHKTTDSDIPPDWQYSYHRYYYSVPEPELFKKTADLSDEENSSADSDSTAIYVEKGFARTEDFVESPDIFEVLENGVNEELSEDEDDYGDSDGIDDPLDETFAVMEDFAIVLEESESVFEEVDDDEDRGHAIDVELDNCWMCQKGIHYCLDACKTEIDNPTKSCLSHPETAGYFDLESSSIPSPLEKIIEARSLAYQKMSDFFAKDTILADDSCGDEGFPEPPSSSSTPSIINPLSENDCPIIAQNCSQNTIDACPHISFDYDNSNSKIAEDLQVAAGTFFSSSREFPTPSSLLPEVFTDYELSGKQTKVEREIRSRNEIASFDDAEKTNSDNFLDEDEDSSEIVYEELLRREINDSRSITERECPLQSFEIDQPHKSFKWCTRPVDQSHIIDVFETTSSEEKVTGNMETLATTSDIENSEISQTTVDLTIQFPTNHPDQDVNQNVSSFPVTKEDVMLFLNHDNDDNALAIVEETIDSSQKIPPAAVEIVEESNDVFHLLANTTSSSNGTNLLEETTMSTKDQEELNSINVSDVNAVSEEQLVENPVNEEIQEESLGVPIDIVATQEPITDIRNINDTTQPAESNDLVQTLINFSEVMPTDPPISIATALPEGEEHENVFSDLTLSENDSPIQLDQTEEPQTETDTSQMAEGLIESQDRNAENLSTTTEEEQEGAVDDRVPVKEMVQAAASLQKTVPEEMTSASPELLTDDENTERPTELPSEQWTASEPAVGNETDQSTLQNQNLLECSLSDDESSKIAKDLVDDVICSAQDALLHEKQEEIDLSPIDETDKTTDCVLDKDQIECNEGSPEETENSEEEKETNVEVLVFNPPKSEVESISAFVIHEQQQEAQEPQTTQETKFADSNDILSRTPELDHLDLAVSVSRRSSKHFEVHSVPESIVVSEAAKEEEEKKDATPEDNCCGEVFLPVPNHSIQEEKAETSERKIAIQHLSDFAIDDENPDVIALNSKLEALLRNEYRLTECVGEIEEFTQIHEHSINTAEQQKDNLKLTAASSAPPSGQFYDCVQFFPAGADEPNWNNFTAEKQATEDPTFGSTGDNMLYSERDQLHHANDDVTSEHPTEMRPQETEGPDIVLFAREESKTDSEIQPESQAIQENHEGAENTGEEKRGEVILGGASDGRVDENEATPPEANFSLVSEYVDFDDTSLYNHISTGYCAALSQHLPSKEIVHFDADVDAPFFSEAKATSAPLADIPLEIVDKATNDVTHLLISAKSETRKQSDSVVMDGDSNAQEAISSDLLPESSNCSVCTDSVPTNPLKTDKSLKPSEPSNTFSVIEEVSHFLSTACFAALALASPSAENTSPTASSFNTDIIEDASKYVSSDSKRDDDNDQ